MYDPDIYLKEAQVINFDMIHSRCWGDEESMSDNHYQTAFSSDFKKMPQKDRKKAFSAC